MPLPERHQRKIATRGSFMSALLSSGRALPKRVRNELRFRQITVQSKQLIAGKFWRITFAASNWPVIIRQALMTIAKFSSPTRKPERCYYRRSVMKG